MTFLMIHINQINGNKLRTYRLYKRSIGAEPYIRSILNRSERKTIAKFRSGSLPLNIETGRFTRPKTPVENRVCTMCSSNSVEDETHFLVDCEFYSDLRFKLFKTALEINSDFLMLTSKEKLSFIMSDSILQTIAGIVLTKMFRRRQLSFI